MSIFTVPVYLAAGQVVGTAMPAVLLTGLAGVAAVVAIGSAVIALSARRSRPTTGEEVTPAPRP